MLHKLTLLLSFLLLAGYTIPEQKMITESGKVEYTSRVVLEEKFEFKSELTFNPTKSYFQWRLNNSEQIPGTKNSEGIKVNVQLDDSIGHFNMYNTSTDRLKSRVILDEVYLLKEKKPDIDWSIQNETKQINSYTCQKATAFFRGRTYTAWFTTEIPVAYGPWKLSGLPGLILEAYDREKEIYFSAAEITLGETDISNKIPLNGNEKNITLKEYQEITSNIGERMAKKIMKSVSEIDADISVASISEPKLMETFGKKGSS